MPDQGAGAELPRTPLSVCILACKDLSLNMRTMRQARSLAEAGHSVTIVGFKTPDPKLVPQGTEGRLLVVKAPYPALLMARLWLTRLWLGEAAQQRAALAAVAADRSRGGLFAARVARRLSGLSFDVVQAHFDRSLIAAAALARRSGAKLVFDSVEVPFDPELLPRAPGARVVRQAEHAREAAIARRADGWITINDTFADAAVVRFGIARPLVLRNFQDGRICSSDGRLRRDLGLGDDARILLHLNTMRAGEGLETVIDALAQLPAEFHLVGLGPTPQSGYLKALRQRARVRAVAHRFHVAPMQPPHAVPAYIAGADIGVIAREGDLQNLRMSLPNRVFQLIAARLPIVTTSLPEISSVVRDWGLGEVFDERDSAGLAAAITRVSEPAALARYREAADRAARVFVWERGGVQYVKFIESVARGEVRATAPEKPSLGQRAGTSGDDPSSRDLASRPLP